MADAQVSGACGSDTMWVRLPSPAPKAKTALLLVFAFLSEELRPNICFRLFAPNVNSHKMGSHKIRQFYGQRRKRANHNKLCKQFLSKRSF